jgi:8-amino-7-oxononanoate synthase
MKGRSLGLSPGARTLLLKTAAQHPLRTLAATLDQVRAAPTAVTSDRAFTDLPGARDMALMARVAGELDIIDPFFRVHDGIAGAQTMINGRRYDNFTSYDYLSLNGHAVIAQAVAAAVFEYGTTVSASRLVSGDRRIHHELEAALAAQYRAEAALAFVGGHATNVTVIGHLMGPRDLILHDQLVHNSILEGAALSGARRVAFRHNDPAAAALQLSAHRTGKQRALLVLEGHYGMDGDVPDLAAFIAVARAHDCWLMVDEAHSLGVLGMQGRGIFEHCGVDPSSVDLWMGTLSKALVSCGGYIAGRRELIDFLRRSAPGFVYSVGLPPPAAAAALAALQLMAADPSRLVRLRANAAMLLKQVIGAGFDTGGSIGAAIVPVIVGSSLRAARLSQQLFELGINAMPIIYPAVPERSARLRLFVNADHTAAQMDNVGHHLSQMRQLSSG